MKNVFLLGRIGPVLIAVSVFALHVTLPASASESAPVPRATVSSEAAPPSPPSSAAPISTFARFGAKFTFDASTGRLQSPTEEQLAALRAALAPLMTRPETPPAPRTYANGMVRNQLGVWNFGASYAFIDPELGLQTGCVESIESFNTLAPNKQPVE